MDGSSLSLPVIYLGIYIEAYVTVAGAVQMCTVSGTDLTSCTSAGGAGASGIYINAAGTVAYLGTTGGALYKCPIKVHTRLTPLLAVAPAHVCTHPPTHSHEAQADGTFDTCQSGSPSGMGFVGGILVAGG